MEENTRSKKKNKYDYKKIAVVSVGLIIALFLLIKLIMWIVSLIFGHGISSEIKIIFHSYN